ncbi:uncharacterized protein ATNIH1004_011704 [Aspergillus tanneri]|uniref:Uncharacterized protein n=1 Tax=Aspergillus tanneri TaxID=1220188 RepID=A0A5M9M484_9EURO|nr:uncharacterized protein ATNIH1004_011704 [Aspergillus tanneri]KAA8641568.1 hypothetical protein ATNIH1004_011704 [Aspergillus tanneri]
MPSEVGGAGGDEGTRNDASISTRRMLSLKTLGAPPRRQLARYGVKPSEIIKVKQALARTYEESQVTKTTSSDDNANRHNLDEEVRHGLETMRKDITERKESISLQPPNTLFNHEQPHEANPGASWASIVDTTKATPNPKNTTRAKPDLPIITLDTHHVDHQLKESFRESFREPVELRGLKSHSQREC